jgi:hypothetical protein
MADQNHQKTSSMEEFKEYARLLNEIQALNSELLDKMAGDVPKKVYSNGFEKLSDGESQLKSDLEDRMAEEHPDEWSVDVFYGDE